MRADQQVYIITRPTNDGKDSEIVYIDPSWKNLLLTLSANGTVKLAEPKQALTLMRVGQSIDFTVNDKPYSARSWYMQSTKWITENKPFEIEALPPKPEEKPEPVKTPAKAKPAAAA